MSALQEGSWIDFRGGTRLRGLGREKRGEVISFFLFFGWLFLFESEVGIGSKMNVGTYITSLVYLFILIETRLVKCSGVLTVLTSSTCLEH